MRLWIQMFCLVIGATLCSSRVLAATAAEMLEKGIYNEETVGNLDEAIKIYRQIVDEAGETKRLAANAQFRLAQCLLKQQKKDDAIDAFKALVKNYPEQKELVAKAKLHLPETLKLSKAPWKDGERLTLTMKLPGGQTIGLLGLAVDADKLNARDVWKFAVRRFVSGGENQGVSLLTVDQLSNRPIRTTWNHTVLGTADSVWHDGKVVISSVDKAGKTEKKTVEFDDIAFANDQWVFGCRQLPLAVGYKVTFPLRVAFTGGAPLELEVDVTKKETIKTPVGEFDCFRLETNIAQTYWIADVPERYLVRFTEGGVDAMLTSISTSEKTTRLENKNLGFVLTVPNGWFYHELGSRNEHNASAYGLVAPWMGAAMVSVKDRSLLDRDDRESVQVWAESKISRGKRRVKDYGIRTGSMQDTQLAGADAKTYIADHKISGAEFSQGITLALTDSKAIAVAVFAKKSDFDAHREMFDALRNSISLR